MLKARTSVEGLEKIEIARRRKKWNRQDVQWIMAASVSLSTLKRFWERKEIREEYFEAICRAVGIPNWQEICDPSTSSKKQEKAKLKFTLADVYKLPYQNLKLQTSKFLGREEALEKLLELISLDFGSQVVIISGMGGIGKTSLVVEAAYLCLKFKALTQSQLSPQDYPLYMQGLNLEPPIFDAIIFTSAKEEYLSGTEITSRLGRESTLRDIFQEIAWTLDPTITQVLVPEEQVQRVYLSLRRQSTLLIIDNWETISDQEQLKGFITDLPATTKVVITTRERVVMRKSVAICLEPLSEAESIQLIQHKAAYQNVEINEKQAQQLYQRVGGLPVVFTYIIGQLASGCSLNPILDPSTPLSPDIVKFCLDSSINPLRNSPAYQLLMALAIFKHPPTENGFIEVAGFKTDEVAIEQGLEKLRQLSLIEQQKDRDRYDMLPVTREYTIIELKKHPDFEREARERWVSWHLKFAHKYGGKDWGNWQEQYDHLEAEWFNLSSVLDWCIARDRYDDTVNLGMALSYYLYLYGHWDTGLSLLDWAFEGARQRNDQKAIFKFSEIYGWIMLLMDDLERAETLMLAAWELHKYASLIDQAYLVDIIAILRIRQNRFAEALNWIEIEESIAEQLQERECNRFRVYALCCRAEIEFIQKNYDRAQILYEQALELATAIDWQRYINYAQNWLADIAIAQGDLEAAIKLITNGLESANCNKDRMRIAAYQRSYAHLEKARGNFMQARDWAAKAQKSFNQLGMKRDAEDMQILAQHNNDET